MKPAAPSTAGKPPALAVTALASAYGDREVLTDINITLEHDEVLCLIGHNGAGKSTLLKLLFGLHKPTRGTIALRGEAVKPTPGAMSAQGVAYVPEGRGVFPGLSVQENFALALSAGRLKRQEGQVRIEEVLSIQPQLRQLWKRPAGQLSGGQQQMVSIGRALLTRPSILLLDEPSIGLAPKLFQDLLAPIRAIQRQRGMAILLVEQQIGEAFSVSDRVVAMKSGAIVFVGKPDDLADPARLLQLF